MVDQAKQTVTNVKSTFKLIVDFVKQLMRLTVTSAFLGLGLYSMYQGHLAMGDMVKAILLVFTGSIVAIYGCLELYRTLIRKVA